MPIPQDKINELFDVKPLTEQQIKAKHAVTVAGKIFAETINRDVPDCSHKSQLIDYVVSVVQSSYTLIENPKEAVGHGTQTQAHDKG